jgi:hypothetical protein
MIGPSGCSRLNAASLSAVLVKNFLPPIFGISQHCGYELPRPVIGGAYSGGAWGFISGRLSAVEDFSASDQYAGINSKRPSDQPQYHYGADAQSASASRYCAGDTLSGPSAQCANCQGWQVAKSCLRWSF